MADFQCNNEEQVVFPLIPTTGRGAPAPVDGAITAVTIAPPGSTAVLIPHPEEAGMWIARSGDLSEEVAFEVTADALVGDGVQNISRVITLSVSSALAAGFSLGAARTEPKPVPVS